MTWAVDMIYFAPEDQKISISNTVTTVKFRPSTPEQQSDAAAAVAALSNTPDVVAEHSGSANRNRGGHCMCSVISDRESGLCRVRFSPSRGIQGPTRPNANAVHASVTPVSVWR